MWDFLTFRTQKRYDGGGIKIIQNCVALTDDSLIILPLGQLVQSCFLSSLRSPQLGRVDVVAEQDVRGHERVVGGGRTLLRREAN